MRELESEIYSLRHPSSNDKDFDTFGKTRTKSEINIVHGEENFQEDDENLKSLFERRIKDLETQVRHFREKEQQEFTQYIEYNKSKANEIRINSKIDGYDNNLHALLDCLSILSYELWETELKEHGKRSNSGFNSENATTVLHSSRSLTQNHTLIMADTASPVEIGQRLVIKYLNKTLSRLLENNKDLCSEAQSEYVPNDDGDRAVWYLELLESQLGKFSCF